MMADSKTKALFILLTALAFAVPGRSLLADNLEAARRLLEVTDASGWFEQVTTRQTAEVLEAYGHIVRTSTGFSLPDNVVRQISLCYQETYAWEIFETGFIRIFAQNLTQVELDLLIDFFGDKSVPPPQINQFKALREKAAIVELNIIDFMVGQTAGCDEQNVSLILAFLSDRGVDTTAVEIE